MDKRLLVALAAVVLSILPAQAQNSIPGIGWNTTGQVATNDMPYLVTALQGTLSNERQIAVGSGLTTTDNGANGTFVIGLGPVLSYFYGTGATTQQAAVNAIFDFPSKAADDIWYYNGTNVVRLPKGADGQVVGIDSGTHHVAYISPAGSGTVTSVGMTVPSWLTVTGSPVTGAGTLAVSPTSGLAANSFVGTPDGSTGAVSLRALVSGDIPNLSAAKITSGNLAKAQHATTAVFNDQSNTYSGTFTQDFGASGQTVVIPKKTIGATVGEISIDTDDLAFRGSVGTSKAAKQAITISTTSPLSGGGDLSANRTLTLGTVDYTKGGTGLTSATTGTVLVGNGTGYTQVGPGSNGQVLKSNGTTLSMGNVSGGFGGDSSDGAITISGATGYTAPIQKNASTFTVNASQVLTCTGSPTIINASGAVTVNGTITVAAGSGYKGGVNTPIAAAYGDGGGDGNGPGGGMGGRNHFSSPGTIGGAGGGFGADGGNPNSTATGAWPGGGKAYNTNLIGGSGGGGATYTTVGSMASGDGGGSLIVCAIGAISVPSGGAINALGTAGVGATSGAGPGGGSGGMVFLASQTSISHATGSTINVSGGAGGTASTTAHGGGGAGGRLYRWTQGTVTSTGTFTATGGAAGGTGATAGGTGTATTIAGTPNLPLLTWTFDQGGLNEIEAIRTTTIALKEIKGENVNPLDVTIDGREVVARAAKGDLAKFALYTNPQPLDEALNTVLCVGDHVKVLDNAA